MKRIVLPVMFVLSLSLVATAGTVFSKFLSIDGNASTATNTKDGGMLIAVHVFVNEFPNNSGIGLIRMNAIGKILWEKIYFLGIINSPLAIHETTGGYIVNGETYVEIAPGGYAPRAFILKVNSNGNVTYQKVIETQKRSDAAYDAVVDTSGQTVVVGTTTYLRSATNFVLEGLIARFDSSGNNVWVKRVFPSSPNARSGTGYSQVLELPDNRLLALGQFGSLPTMSWFSPQGAVLTSKEYMADPFISSSVMAHTNDGNVFMAGAAGIQDGSGSAIFLMKVTPNGDVLWSKAFQKPGSLEIGSIASSQDGGCLVTGSTSAGLGAFIVKFAPSGNVTWGISVNGSAQDFGRYTVEDKDHKILFVGEKFVIQGPDTNRTFILKIDPSTPNSNCSLIKTFKLKPIPMTVQIKSVNLKSAPLPHRFTARPATGHTLNDPVSSGCNSY